MSASYLCFQKVCLWLLCGPHPLSPGRCQLTFQKLVAHRCLETGQASAHPGTWPCCSACGAMFLAMPCDCQVVHQSKGRVPGTVFGSQWQRFPCRHSSTVCGLGMQQAELHSTKENKTGCLLPLWPTDSYFLKRKETRSYSIFSR